MIGDVVGRPGRKAVRTLVPELRRETETSRTWGWLDRQTR